MSPLLWRFRRILGILPNVNTANEVFEELREVVFSLNHIAIASRVLSHKQFEDIRVARDILTVAAIEIIEDSKQNKEAK